jgi:tRNA(fMet)-specific endonuclease VapC
MRDRPPTVRGRLRRARAADESIALPGIALFELWHGVARSGQYRAANAERLRAFLAGGIPVLPFETEDAEIAGELRHGLEGAGRPVGPYDLLIAAQTIRHGATLVTANVGEFSRIPNLDWDDWST